MTMTDADFRKLLPWMYGGRSFLQAYQQDFRRIFLPGSLSEQHEGAVECTAAELVAMVRLALSRGELDIAENHCSKAIRKQILENISAGKSWQPYLYLGEILEKRAAKSSVNSIQKQRFLLQAAALYNFVKNCFRTTYVKENCSGNVMKTISSRLLDIQDNLVLLVEGNPLQCHFDSENDKRELEKLRNEAKICLESLKHDGCPDDNELTEEDGRNKFVGQAAEIRKLCERISSRIKKFLGRIVNQCSQVLGDPPCHFEVVVLGSLARDEMTPYSDLEWAILMCSEEEQFKGFFRNLTNLVHLQIINLGETILPSMGIKALSSEWFYDNVTPRGISFDAFLPQACKTPLGDMEDFELIHCPAKMAEFQSNSWYQKNPGLGEILLTVAPLESDKHVLTDQYSMQLEKYLCSPCDSDNCSNHNPNDNPPCRGACRGVAALRKDYSRYEKMLPSINKSSEDGKLYDVKKEIYRLVDRVFAGLAACFEIRANGAFKILDELEMQKIITFKGRENLASAAGIALQLRITTYLEAGKQGEQVIAKSSCKEKESKFESLYRLLNEEELFHFFFIATPLYEEIKRCCVLDGQIRKSFAQQAFFDCSFAVKGHIYRRILKYEQALDCYERALKRNPESTEMQLCQIDIQLEIDRSAEMAICIKNKLEALIRGVCKKHNLSDGIVDQCGHFVPIIDGYTHLLTKESTWELLKILQSVQGFHLLQGNVDLAQQVFDQWMTLLAAFDGFESSIAYLFLTGITVQLKPEISEKLISFLKKVVDEEGISTRGILCLNDLGELLIKQEKFQQSYQCLQRALAMEHTLYTSNFNPEIERTLTLLGVIAVELRKYEEGKLYYEQLLELRKSLNIANEATLDARLSLACLCATTGHHEEAISYFQNFLVVFMSGGYKRESFLECITHCQVASSWHALNENENALKSAMDAKECLTSITSVQNKVPVTCAVAEIFCTIGRHEDAVLLVKKDLEEVDLQLEIKHKAEYLKFLGEVYVQQGLVSQAEGYYQEALDCLMISEENTCAIVECLLQLCNILLDKGDSSEVKSKLEEAWKYASSATGDGRFCNYIRKIGKCWETLGDVNQALIWYGVVLAEHKESSALVNAPLFESELHVKLGDMTNLYFSSSGSDVSLSPEQRQNAERVHYDRAENVLRRQTSLGNVNPTTTQLFVLLASRYRSIDLAEEETLLFEALEMCNQCKAIYETSRTCEIEAAILTGLSDIKWLTGDYVSASAFLARSLRKEMELYSSAPYYSHISDLLFRLTRLHLKGNDNEQLGEVTQRVLEFVDVVEEDVIAKNVTKNNAAMCFWSASIFYLSLKDDGKATSALERAGERFEKVEEDSALIDNKQQGSTRKERLFPEYPYIFYIEDLISTVLLPLLFPGTNKSLVDVFSLIRESLVSSGLDTSSHETEITAEEEQTKCSSGTDAISSHPNVATLLRILSKLLHLIPSKDRSSVVDSLRSYPCTAKSIGVESNTVTHDTYDRNQSKDIENFEAKLDNLHLLVEIVNCDLKKGNILQASRTIRDALKPSAVSLFDTDSPGNIDPAEYLINEALKAKKSYGTMMMLAYLHLADIFPSEPRIEAKLSKLRGECNLSEKNYRIAALCFTHAAGFFARIKTLDPVAHTEHFEILIELTRSHMLCNAFKTAWQTGQEGLRLLCASESELVNTRVQTKLFLLSAQCLTRFATSDHQLEEAVSICRRGLVCSKLMHCSTQEEHWEFVELNYQIQHCLATALAHLNKVDESRKIVKENVQFLKNKASVFEIDLKRDAVISGTDNLKIYCCLYSWIGQAEVMSGDENVALMWLTKSLSAFLAMGLPDTVFMEEEFLELLDVVTATKANVAKVYFTTFEQTIELCMQKLLEEQDGMNTLLRFFEVLAQLYVDRGREEEAIVVYERALTVVECTGDFPDPTKVREMITTLLAHCHMRQSIKDAGKGTAEERKLAEKYYQTGLEIKGNFVVLRISYAGFICDQERFEEASKVLEGVTAGGEELWDIQITCSYSSRVLWSRAIKRYIEDHGECVTTAGILAHSILVYAYVAMGKRKQAAAVCKKLSMKSEEVEIFSKRPPFMQYVLGACHKALASLVNDQSCLEFQDANFPLSESNLEKLYNELDEWAPALEYSQNVKISPSSGEPAGSFNYDPSTLSSSGLPSNAQAEPEGEHESRPLIVDFLEMLQVQDGIFDKPFVTQKAILEQCSLADDYFVYDTLGMLLSARENIDGAIKCYEHCLELDEDYSYGQDLVATLAELYQVKAITALNEDNGSYTSWMNTAQECFDKLRLKTEKLDSFVARALGSFLSRQGRFEEAISQFKSVLEETCGTEISFTLQDKSLVSVYLGREIEARGEVNLPLEILVYHEMVSAYWKLNDVENSQQSIHQMEKQVNHFQSSPEYPLILSVLGYTHKEVGNKERAADIFLSVLLMNPGHVPVVVALENCI